MAKKIPEDAGRQALKNWRLGDATAAQQRMAVRYTLQFFADLHPGHAVEVRVPPAGAVQVLRGTNHRRGTPPAVVEMQMSTWLALVVGDLSWAQAITEGRVDASGERADLSRMLPIQGL